MLTNLNITAWRAKQKQGIPVDIMEAANDETWFMTPVKNSNIILQKEIKAYVIMP